MDESVEEFLDRGIKQQEEFARIIERTSKELHKVFIQNADGVKLLETWKEQLIMVPTLNGDSTQFEAGINEGIKMFVRNIIINCKKIEDADV